MRTVTTGHARTPRARGVHPPPRRARGRRQQLVQGCFTTIGVGLVVALSSLAPPLSTSSDPGVPSIADHEPLPLWNASWSQRFPGCVAMVLWPQGEPPVALVTRSADGSVHRLPVGSGRRVPQGDRVVGACR